MPLLSRLEEDGAANAPFAAIAAEEEDAGVGGAAEASLVGEPVEVAAELGDAGIGVAEEQGQVGGGTQLSGIEWEVV